MRAKVRRPADALEELRDIAHICTGYIDQKH